MSIGNLWRLVTEGVGPAGEAIINTFHFDDPAGDATRSPFAVAEGFELGCVPEILAVLADIYTYLRTTATCVAGDAITATAESLSLAGSLGDNGVADDLWSGVILKKSDANTGRSHRGRNFFSPVDAAVVDDDGFVDASAAPWDALLVAIGGFITTDVEEADLGLLASPTGWAILPRYAVLRTYADTCGIQRRRRARSGT